MKLILVIGLPGSGKTSWAREQVARAEREGRVSHLLDDPRTWEQVEAALRGAVSASADALYIVDPHLCEPLLRVQARHRLRALVNAPVEEVFFENDPVQCHRNASRRYGADRAVTGAIERWSRVYQPPNQAIPVYAAPVRL